MTASISMEEKQRLCSFGDLFSLGCWRIWFRDTPKWELKMIVLLGSASAGCAGYEVYRSLTLTVTG